jgi:5-methylcytosine-specific restriction protein A
MPIIEQSGRKKWQPKPQPYEYADRSFNYNSPAWRKLSRAFRRTHPLCAQCDREGRIKQSQVTDHIIAIRDGGDVWDMNNLEALCKKCHDKKTRQEINNRCAVELSPKTINIGKMIDTALENLIKKGIVTKEQVEAKQREWAVKSSNY